MFPVCTISFMHIPFSEQNVRKVKCGVVMRVRIGAASFSLLFFLPERTWLCKRKGSLRNIAGRDLAFSGAITQDSDSLVTLHPKVGDDAIHSE